MKKPLMILSSMLVAVGAFAQGQVNFANHVTAATPVIDAPVFVGSVPADITTLTGRASGATYLAQLYAGPVGGVLAAIGSPVPFRTGAAAGYWTSATLSIATVAPGAIASVQIRAWAASAGASYELASAANGAIGQSAILAITTGGVGIPPSLPSNLAGLAAFSVIGGVPIVPEPSVLALGALGGLALLLRRRK